MQKFLFFFLFILMISCAFAEKENTGQIITGSECTELYLPGLTDKNVAVMANQSSLIYDSHLVDSLLSLGVNIVRIFSPEHGFRGNEEAGAAIEDGIDSKTQIHISSLYGKNKKPEDEDLRGVDIILFDLQDVGTRFYTYISSLHYLMEACAENDIELIILDRPNPNGDYIDGPVLEKDFSSFVGMHPVPVVHGMTIGEYAKMINGEAWLKDGMQSRLKVIACKNYSRKMIYKPAINPSPNLPDYQAIRLYPSLCFFEGTAISIGRGTDFPFKVYGHSDFAPTGFSFIPECRPGFAVNPKLEGQECYGYDLREYPVNPDQMSSLNMEWLISAYANFQDKEEFFISYFELLAGTDKLRNQIESGWSEDEIRESWQVGLDRFKKIREKYLIYP
jgi:uncharacterized protein YbbC (DUF1343 family)